MSKIFHKKPLFLQIKKENEYHQRFNEKLFYPSGNSHSRVTPILLSLSKRIKLLIFIVAFFAISAVVFLSSSTKNESINVKNDKKEDLKSLEDDKYEIEIVNKTGIEPKK